ncbi:MAG: hypothetical protein JNN20_18310 [Betaproteobacteria bacterium]|nr:hypothetical protein [Betaproteobacteria bacterium]
MNTSPPNSTNATIVTLNAEQQNRLDANLDSLRSATEPMAMPAAFEAKLMSAFKAHHAKKRRREILAQWFAPGFALAASVGMSAWMVLAPMAQPALDAGPDAMTMLANAETPFIALQSLEQIALEPQPRLIETAVPRMWLASYGVPVSPEVAGDSLRAEMLVSASGQPLAMRFLP